MKKSSKKFLPGMNQCYYCGTGRHAKCRPRLDETLCSCACEYAELTRLHVKLLIIDSEKEKKPQPTLRQALKMLGRNYKPGVGA